MKEVAVEMDRDAPIVTHLSGLQRVVENGFTEVVRFSLTSTE
jgi:hypothetical protein